MDGNQVSQQPGQPNVGPAPAAGNPPPETPVVQPQQPVVNPTPTEPQPSPDPVPAPTTSTETAATVSGPTVSMSPQSTPESTNPDASTIPDSSVPPETQNAKKPKKMKMLIPILVVGVLLIGGAAAAYNSLVLNSPEGIWKSAMSNTSKGFSELVNIASEEPSKGGTVEGNFKISSPTVADANFSGKWYEDKSEYSLDVGFAGFRPKIELRTISANEDSSPDIYIKAEELGGLQSILGLYDPNVSQLIEQVNGNWYVIDHTLYEQALSGGESELEFNEEDIREVGDKISSVLSERLFTDDEEKAVVIVEEPIGKEDFKGASTYKYKVRAQKEQTKQFVSAIVESLKDTKVEELVTEGSDKSLEETIELADMLENIEEQDFSNATAEAWVDLDTKLLRNVRITPDSKNENESGHIDIGIPYDGGDEIPFEISLHYEESESEQKIDVVAAVSYNKENKEIKINMNVDGELDSQAVKVEANIKSTPSNEDIDVEIPSGAKNIYELLGLFYGGVPSGGFPEGTLGATDEQPEIPLLQNLLPTSQL